MELFFPQIQVKTKKGLHQKFPPSGGLRSLVHQSQIIGGNAAKDYTQIIGGDTSPHPLRVSAPLILQAICTPILWFNVVGCHIRKPADASN